MTRGAVFLAIFSFDYTFEFASRFCNASKISIGIIKNTLNQSFYSGLQAISELEGYGQAMCFDSDYHRGAISRFLN